MPEFSSRTKRIVTVATLAAATVFMRNAVNKFDNVLDRHKAPPKFSSFTDMVNAGYSIELTCTRDAGGKASCTSALVKTPALN